MISRALVKAAYYAKEYDGYRIDRAELTEPERAMWDEVASADAERRAQESEGLYDIAIDWDQI